VLLTISSSSLGDPIESAVGSPPHKRQGAGGLSANGFFMPVLSRMNRDRFCFRGASFVASVLTLAVLCGACNKSTAKLYPVKGKVLFKDQPAEGAKVVLSPTGEENVQYRGVRPTATVKADGTFEVYTDPHGAGAPPGEYAVLVTWFPPRDENPNANPKNKLPAKYGDPTKPPLKASVKEGENDLGILALTP
jgi:hypothetical protein